jgi:hypothetical protein
MLKSAFAKVKYSIQEEALEINQNITEQQKSYRLFSHIIHLFPIFVL